MFPRRCGRKCFPVSADADGETFLHHVDVETFPPPWQRRGNILMECFPVEAVRPRPTPRPRRGNIFWGPRAGPTGKHSPRKTFRNFYECFPVGPIAPTWKHSSRTRPTGKHFPPVLRGARPPLRRGNIPAAWQRRGNIISHTLVTESPGGGRTERNHFVFIVLC